MKSRIGISVLLFGVVIASQSYAQIFVYHVKGDYDGDGKTDIGIWQPPNFTWTIFNSSGIANTTKVWGEDTDIPVPADYNGDGKTDIAVWRPDNGNWYISPSTTTTWGVYGDIPVPGDYNGDGKAEVAVFRPSNGTWYISPSTTYTWGVNGDIPVPGDYNGDGKTDIAVWRPSNGTWYISPSTTYTWGVNGDIPVPGDYNGDGTTDIAVWRPSNVTWYMAPSTTRVFGSSDEIPVPGDYDGDAKTDIAVWKPSVATFYIVNSSGIATTVKVAGSATDNPRDIPLPNFPIAQTGVPTGANCDWYSPFDKKKFAASVDLSGHPGNVFGSTAVILDFWGQSSQHPLIDDATTVFGTIFTSSRFWAKTAEYGSRSGFLGRQASNHSGLGGGVNLRKSDVELYLREDVFNGSVAGGSNQAVVVILPSNVNFVDGSGNVECHGCGHHDTFFDSNANKQIYYATVSTSGDERQDMYVVSHEVGEIVTDFDNTTGFWAPQVPGSSRTGTLENGDLCQNIRDTIKGSPTAMLWSQANCGCQ